MPGLTDLLDTWEAGLAADDARRTLLLHALARPAASLGELLEAPVGDRDADLFGLRRALFGARLAVQLACDDCGEELELELDADDILGASRPSPAPLQVETGGWLVRFRLPTAGDLQASAEAATPAEARALLLALSVLEATCAGEPAVGDELPDEVEAEVAAAMATADPRADIRLDVPCPGCGHHTHAVLDIGPFLWSELDAWARGLLIDVHLLATAYGWSEPEVLALSPHRRRQYLELAGHA